MGKKRKKKLTATEKQEKARRKAMYETIFINGKQKRVLRCLSLFDYGQSDDPVFLMQNEMWEELHAWEQRQDVAIDLACDQDKDGAPFRSGWVVRRRG